MSNSVANKRKALFFLFSDNLSLLKANGLLKEIDLKYDRTFICPICLKQFSIDDLEPSSSNMLTLEHAPPESAGGNGVALTCKQCNSEAGRHLDFHLTERLLEADRRALSPNSFSRVKVTNNGVTVQANLLVSNDGEIKMHHSEKNNNLIKLLEFIDAVHPIENPKIDIDFGQPKTEYSRFEIALLKSAYILTFAKFGYSFILGGEYDVVREQILNPTRKIYPDGFYTNKTFLKQGYEGVNQCNSPGAEGLFCVFSLTIATSSRRYGIHLPIPTMPAWQLVKNLHWLAKHNGELSFDRDNSSEDFLTNTLLVKSLLSWFYRVRLSKVNSNDRINIPTAVNYLVNPISPYEITYFNYPPRKVTNWPRRLKLRR